MLDIFITLKMVINSYFYIVQRIDPGGWFVGAAVR
jgi:hypothetical protein